jgi:DNA polymerase/3'-5' exonuclease PolX
MSTGPRFPRAAALAAAKEIASALQPFCAKLIVAGSLRRRKQDVGDIEVVFIPKFVTVPDPNDLLRNPVTCDAAEIQVNTWVAEGKLTKRPKKDGSLTWGAQIKLAVHVSSGIPVDLFAGNPANWWCLLVCRTGSAESNLKICNAAIAKGWKWNPYGAGFSDRYGRLVHRAASERDVFEAVGLPYKEPWER